MFQKAASNQGLKSLLRYKDLAQWIRISEILACYVTKAVTCGMFIGCVGTYAHGRQVISLLC